MARGISFEIGVAKVTSNYLRSSDSERVKKISQNLEKDQLWGWCVPEVKAVFDIYTGVAQLAYGSYASEEDFKSSPDYEYLKESAIGEIKIKMDYVRKGFEQVEKFYQGRNKTLI